MQTIHTRGYTPLLALAFAILTLGVALTGCSGRVNDTSIRSVSMSDAANRIDKKPEGTLILDARSGEAFAAGHIPGARLTRLGEVDLTSQEPRFGGWDQIIVYGDDRGSGTARALVKRLLQTKHKNVFLLEDGFTGWRAAGRPIEQGE